MFTDKLLMAIKQNNYIILKVLLDVLPVGGGWLGENKCKDWYGVKERGIKTWGKTLQWLTSFIYICVYTDQRFDDALQTSL